MAQVLVVEDEADSLEMVSRFLERQGHRVTAATDGQAALASLLEQPPDALVLDVRLPRMDGIALLEMLRSYGRWHALPVILLTAHATPAQTRKARQLGVGQVLYKAHFTLHELADAIDDQTGSQRGRKSWYPREVEDRQIACPTCGSRYHARGYGVFIPIRQSADCDVCGAELFRWEGPVDYACDLIARAPAGRSPQPIRRTQA